MSATTDAPELNEFTEPDSPSPASGSVLEQLRRRRQEIATNGPKPKFLPVPGMEGALVVEYRYPEGGSDAIVDAVQRAQSASERDALLNANTDVLVRCCHQIHGQQPGAEREPLEPDPGRPPLKFGARLAELLNIMVPEDTKSPARFVCRHVFSPRAAGDGVFDGDIALMAQAGQVISWLTKSDEEVGRAFVGE